MARILAFDYGEKRVGLAVSDPERIIANSLGAVDTDDIFDYVKDYCRKEKVDTFVVGYPINPGHAENEIIKKIEYFISRLHAYFPLIPVHKVDERYTSRIAERVLAQSGVNKKTKQQKGKVDTISANLILQSYMDRLGRDV